MQVATYHDHKTVTDGFNWKRISKFCSPAAYYLIVLGNMVTLQLS